MKRMFMVALSFILVFSGLGVTALQSASAETDLAGTYYISAAHSGKVLAVENGNSGTIVKQQDKQDSDYQKWVITAVSNEVYQIQNLASGLVLDVAQGVTTDGAKVIQYQNVGSDNQQWKLVGSSDGSYEIVSIRSGKNLDVENASRSNGADVIQWTSNNGENQKFVLEGETVAKVYSQYELGKVESLLKAIDNIPEELLNNGNSKEIENYFKEHNITIHIYNPDIGESLPIIVQPRGFWSCSLEIGELVVMNAIPVAKITKIKQYIKALGGITETAKLLVGATTAKEKIGALSALMAELSGFNNVRNECGF